MIVEVSLFGFGDDRPGAFGAKNAIDVNLQDSATLEMALASAGFDDLHGLSIIVNGSVVPRQEWATASLSDGDALKVLMAIEGG